MGRGATRRFRISDFGFEERMSDPFPTLRPTANRFLPESTQYNRSADLLLISKSAIRNSKFLDASVVDRSNAVGFEKSNNAFAAVPDAGLCSPNFIGLQTRTVPWATTKAKIRNVILNVAVPNELIETEDWRGRRSSGHGGFKSAEVLRLPVPISPSPRLCIPLLQPVAASGFANRATHPDPRSGSTRKYPEAPRRARRRRGIPAAGALPTLD